MHIPTKYEMYLQHEITRYGHYNSDDNEVPSWLVHELEVYSWIHKLSQKMIIPLENRYVSKQLLNRIENITTIRFRKYKNISPVLKEAIESIVAELAGLHDDLIKDAMWESKNCLSWIGFKRWKKATEVIDKYYCVTPNPEWREDWERKVLNPYCTRREAEELAKKYISNHFKINLHELGEARDNYYYYYHLTAKDGIFKMKFGKLDRKATLNKQMQDIGVIKVNMLTREASEIV